MRLINNVIVQRLENGAARNVIASFGSFSLSFPSVCAPPVVPRRSIRDIVPSCFN